MSAYFFSSTFWEYLFLFFYPMVVSIIENEVFLWVAPINMVTVFFYPNPQFVNFGETLSLLILIVIIANYVLIPVAWLISWYFLQQILLAYATTTGS